MISSRVIINIIYNNININLLLDLVLMIWLYAP